MLSSNLGSYSWNLEHASLGSYHLVRGREREGEGGRGREEGRRKEERKVGFIEGGEEENKRNEVGRSKGREQRKEG